MGPKICLAILGIWHSKIYSILAQHHAETNLFSKVLLLLEPYFSYQIIPYSKGIRRRVPTVEKITESVFEIL
jgi:hypothetical protein